MKKGIALESIKDLDAVHIQALKTLWITTAEELVSIALTPDGVRLLASHLSIDEEAAVRLVEKIKQRIPTPVLEQLAKSPSESHGMGALKPKKEETK